jgi:hypothetical protein
MARIRTIKPDIATHEGLFEAEQKSGLPIRLAFTLLLTCADKEGRFKWRPRELKLSVLPYDDEINFEDVLNCLANHGFIVKYEANGQKYGCYANWKKHQKPNNKEADSAIPSPEEGEIIVENTVEKTPSLDLYQASLGKEKASLDLTQGERKGKGKEGEGERNGKGRECEGNHSVTREAREDVKKVFEHWQSVMNHPDAKLGGERVKVIRQSLKAGYTADQLCEAITGCSLTPFYMGDNDRGEKYDGLKHVFKNSDMIDKFLRHARSPPKPRNKTEQLFDKNLSVAQTWAERKKREREDDG